MQTRVLSYLPNIVTRSIFNLFVFTSPHKKSKILGLTGKVLGGCFCFFVFFNWTFRVPRCKFLYVFHDRLYVNRDRDRHRDRFTE